MKLKKAFEMVRLLLVEEAHIQKNHQGKIAIWNLGIK